MISVLSFVMVAAGAFLGGVLRWALTRLLPARRGTLTANTLACLVAGIVIGSALPVLETALLVTGFCGALSTWSTLARELGELISKRDWGGLVAYGGTTLVLGIVAIQVGLRLA